MKFLLALVLVVLPFCSSSFAQVIPLSNADVLSMIAARVPTEMIINRIETSRCHFDTFPTVIEELRNRGVPEEILVVMVAAPIGHPAKAVEKVRIELPPVTVPAIAKSESVTPTTKRGPTSPTEQSATRSADSPEKITSKPAGAATKTVSGASSPADKCAQPSLVATAKVLTNEDLIKLLRAGIPATEVVKVVKTARGNYDLSAKALLALQEVGADVTLFLTMM